MGYYTRHTLTVRGLESQEQFQDLTNSLIEFEILDYALLRSRWSGVLGTEMFFDTYEEVKWYNHITQMTEISKRFPTLTFLLEGAGESNDDMWQEYYHNGEHERCEAVISFPKPQTIVW